MVLIAKLKKYTTVFAVFLSLVQTALVADPDGVRGAGGRGLVCRGDRFTPGDL